MTLNSENGIPIPFELVICGIRFFDLKINFVIPSYLWQMCQFGNFQLLISDWKINLIQARK